MSDKKTSESLINPYFISAGISGLLSSILDNLCKKITFFNEYQSLINTCIPPVSILVAYLIAHLISIFHAYSFTERQALTKLKARKKEIKKLLDQDKDEMNTDTKNTLITELNEIICEISSIGKSNTKFHLSENNVEPNDK
ncbi:hypothetical protein [Snodgrassella alvi]|uniref:hypothetical protein n=1 Tax=Snodgrassella alvi TaxID=1196083 RepID=UPI000C1E84B7|nr:hypothetical protein [Snodgrassella alvi]PIT21785.1 hypothetical protein BGI34_00835 [Snodgrassella alvi]